MKTTFEKVKIDYKGIEVLGIKLKVSSEILIDIETAWDKLGTSKLLEFVCKPKIKFKPVGGNFPKIWKEGNTVSTKMFVYGLVPFGGTHTLYFDKIDAENKILQTKEWDDAAKVWNHKISLKKQTEDSIIYEDEVIIYGGLLTSFIAIWAKSFYKHRQKRWQIVAQNNIQFN
jgi:hypothetical protein